MISRNLRSLRKRHGYSQEEVADKISVSRQAVAKWESGETVPDLANAMQLAEIYHVSLDQLVNHEDEHGGALMPPKGKHIFGVVKVGERGQIVIPIKARELFDIHAGDSLVILGDEAQGLAITKSTGLVEFAAYILDSLKEQEES
ncbi:XRE family transcriptional regulator [Ktedonosporobacter rubrisoli]|uniref:XRE family transcriptional regulator n=1 Tax=Ktedonosporobacter rubrisoli TaxID=2509675 RepID=A0A4P6JIX5_KTERU|nr:helix-turn-helix domain-containing protein [Ktedonosporobacter rubrisoli]QBD75028.1 XRE family transcriptional regulator [Ktedonosporobacter rubrisoli]